MWVVHWKIYGQTGHGRPVSLLVGCLICRELNAMWGDITHWMEEA